jgi:predicted metalloprotease with PDZ domain
VTTSTRTSSLLPLLLLPLLALAACATSPPTLTPQPTPWRHLSGAEDIQEKVFQDAPLRYFIRLDPLHNRAEVTAHLASPPSPLPLRLPTAWAGLDDLPLVISGLEARCQDQPLTLELGPQGQPQVLHERCLALTLRYHLKTQLTPAPDDEALRARFWPRLDGQGALLYGQAAIVLPGAVGAEPVPVEVEAPARWEVAASWLPARRAGDAGAPPDRARWSFLAQDAAHLRDAVLLAGRLRHHARPLQDGRLLRVITQGELPLPDEALLDAAARLTNAQRRFLPGAWRWPAGAAQLSVFALPRGPGAALEGTGRRGGVVLELGLDALASELYELLSHELFHVINGHLLLSDPDEQYAALWFKEGVTSYLGLVAALQAHLIDFDWFLERVGEWIGNYYGNPRALTLPAARLGERFWSDPHARRLPYDKGALLGLLLDEALWSEEGPGLARLIRGLLQEAQGGRCPLELVHSVALAQARSPGPLEGLWAEQVEGVSALPLSAALGRLGLSLERSQRAVPYYGFQVGVDAGGAFVSSVDPGGPASRAGLRRGERLRRRPRLPTAGAGGPVQLEVERSWGMQALVLSPESGRREAYRVQVSDPAGRWRDLWGLPLRPILPDGPPPPLRRGGRRPPSGWLL